MVDKSDLNDGDAVRMSSMGSSEPFNFEKVVLTYQNLSNSRNNIHFFVIKSCRIQEMQLLVNFGTHQGTKLSKNLV